MDLLRLFPLYLRLTAMNELQYRVNFIVQLFSSLLALTAGLVSLALIFSQTSDLNGWSRPELLVVMGVHLMMGGVIRAVIQPNMNRLIDDIHQGTLDYSLTKPADAQVLVSVREFRVWQVVDALTGVVVLLVGVAEFRAGVGLLHAAAFVVALILGAVMIYCFWLMLTTGAFWIIRMEFIVELFQGVYQAGRWPVTIYPDWMRAGLTFLVPIAFAVTVPAEALTRRLTAQTLLGAAVLAAFLLVVSRWVWSIGLRHYSGASA